MGTDVVAQIRRATRTQFTAEEKIRIVLEGVRGEMPVSELCRREAIAPTMYYRWSKEPLSDTRKRRFCRPFEHGPEEEKKPEGSLLRLRAQWSRASLSCT